MFLRTLFVALFLAVVPRQLAAQGIFDAFGFPKTVIATGQTEVVGSVHLALRQGPISPDTLIVDMSPYRITNASPADLHLTTAGNITTGTLAIEADAGRVLIPFNAGGTSGSVRIDGIRVGVAGTNATS